MAEEQDIINKYRGVSSNDTEQKIEEPAKEQTQIPTEETETKEEKETVKVNSVETPEEKKSEDRKEIKNNSFPHVEQIIKDRLARQAKKHQRELEALRESKSIIINIKTLINYGITTIAADSGCRRKKTGCGRSTVSANY